jgi:sugar lactone lactonase YvrE
MQVELLFDAKATLGEGPVWDMLTKKLYWIDILT